MYACKMGLINTVNFFVCFKNNNNNENITNTRAHNRSQFAYLSFFLRPSLSPLSLLFLLLLIQEENEIRDDDGEKEEEEHSVNSFVMIYYIHTYIYIPSF